MTTDKTEAEVYQMLEAMAQPGREALIAALNADPVFEAEFRGAVILEIVRRLKTMKAEAFVPAVCDILSASRI